MIDAETAALMKIEVFADFFYYCAIGLCGLLFLALIVAALFGSKK